MKPGDESSTPHCALSNSWACENAEGFIGSKWVSAEREVLGCVSADTDFDGKVSCIYIVL